MSISGDSRPGAGCLEREAKLADEERRRDDRFFDPAYVADLASLPTPELRRRRGECELFEAELSYTRRLLQGKLDIIRAEIERRSEGSTGGISALKEKLAEILSNGNGTNGPSGNVRHNPIVLPPNAETQRREVERIASETLLSHLDDLPDGELAGIVEQLAEAEKESSQKRRKVQTIIDVIGDELVRRYREGHEDPSALLSS